MKFLTINFKVLFSKQSNDNLILNFAKAKDYTIHTFGTLPNNI